MVYAERQKQIVLVMVKKLENILLAQTTLPNVFKINQSIRVQ